MTTQNCAECGTRAEPGQPFCDACGAVLSWTEGAARTSASGAAGAAGAAGGAGSAGAAGDSRAARPAGAAGGPPASAGQQEPDATMRMRAVSPGEPENPENRRENRRENPEAPEAPEAPEEPEDPEATAERARRLVVPVADPANAAAPPAVSPVLPGRPAATRPQVEAVGKEPGAHGGPPCPWCGTPNHPDRHFCARCAMPMAGEQDTGPGRRRPWWRRMLDSRNREAPWAGERPRLRRGFEHVLRWLGAALVLTLLIFLAVQIPDGIRATRDHFAKRAPVEPDSYRALRSFEHHPPRLAFDKLNDTWWGPGVSQSGEGEWIQARFKEPTRLLELVITPGVSARAEQLREEALPHRLEAEITTVDGSTTTREITLDQGLGPQSRPFRAEDVTSVRFIIVSAYGAADDKQVAIAEIEFFGPSSGGGL